ncbi:MAG: hypothetical protein KDA31_07540 [Phycisphaerales bacterium]|nr:hypothetical protein [Phycisphaerales bacterium]MCB9835738.1 hypothetical protein [Phycisphaera sp.]
MSGRTAAILVVILGALVAAVVLTTPRAGGPNAERVVPLVGVPASQIGAVRVTDAAGDAVFVGQDPKWDGWLVETWDGDVVVGSWPASGTTVSAGMRVLANARLWSGQRHGLAERSEVVILDQNREVVREFGMSSVALGGRVPVLTSDDEWGTIERELANFLSLDSLLAWRDPAVLPGLDASAVTISIDREGDLLALRRVGTSWAVELPVVEPVDGARVQELIDGLVAARSERFVEGKPEQDIVTLMVEAGPSGDRRRYTAIIDTGSLVADVMLFKTDGETTTEVARASMRVPEEFAGLLDLDVTDVVSRRSVATPASEVAGITLEWSDREIARTSSGWASSEDESTAESWLDLLTRRDADEVALSAGDAEGVGTIGLAGFGDLAMGSLRVRAGGGMLWVARDRVWRGYRVGEDDLVRLGVVAPE